MSAKQVIAREELERLARENPLVFGITYVDLLDGKEWEMTTRKWAVEPYLAVNPFEVSRNPALPRRMVITKSTQAGISTMAIVKALHFMTYWTVRVGYMLPRQKDLSDFSSTRLDPILRNSAFLREKVKQPNSVYTKRIGDSYIFFLEGSVEPRSMPIDALYLDEVDLCEPQHVGTALNRLDASQWKLTTYLSTPTIPMYGIDGLYEASDKREWVVRCVHCGYRQVMDWEKNLRVKGAASDPERVWYACQRCDKELTILDIQNGEWVPQHPNRSRETLGYHISQMLTTSAEELYKHYRDPAQSIAEFYRKRLGRPYTIAGGSISREDILVACFEEPYDPEIAPDEYGAYYMGVDQGNQLQVTVGKLERGRKRPKIVHIEIIPYEKGFDRVGQLIQLYKPRRCVIDGDPNRHPVRKLQQDFPGRVIMADYIEHQRERFKLRRNQKAGVVEGITINRTEAFDNLIQKIKEGWIQLPGTAANPLPEVEVWIDHFTGLKRDIEKRRTASGEVDVAVWKKLRADHLAHATLYMSLAVEMDLGSGFRVAAFEAQTTAEQAQEESVYIPNEQVVAEITRHLAEVPKPQLEEYLVLGGQPDYQPPFPLSVKLEKVRKAGFEESDIVWVIQNVL